MNIIRSTLGTVILLYCGNIFAIPIGFTDIGTSLTDETTGIEWLDVLTTANRSFESVSEELESDTGLGLDGWRFATKTEFRELISNFFGIDYDGGHDDSTPPFGDTDSELVELFVNTLGDTCKNRINNPDDTVNVLISPEGTGCVYGYLYETSAPNDQFAATVQDGEYINISDGSFYGDDTDYVWDSATAYTRVGNLAVGSWLVRGWVSVSHPSPIPEPPVMLLFLTGVLGIATVKRFALKSSSQQCKSIYKGKCTRTA